MKKLAIAFVLILLAFSGKGTLLNAQSDLSEGWEKKVMEELQPPRKIMDAIGIKPGMIIGEIGAEIDNEFKINRKDPNNKIPTIKERIEKCAKASGFELVKTETFLPKDYIFILKQKD